MPSNSLLDLAPNIILRQIFKVIKHTAQARNYRNNCDKKLWIPSHAREKKNASFITRPESLNILNFFRDKRNHNIFRLVAPFGMLWMYNLIKKITLTPNYMPLSTIFFKIIILLSFSPSQVKLSLKLNGFFIVFLHTQMQ